jgi:hypothetical protein
VQTKRVITASGARKEKKRKEKKRKENRRSALFLSVSTVFQCGLVSA